MAAVDVEKQPDSLTVYNAEPTVKRFLENWDSNALYLQGPWGSGKSAGGLWKLVFQAQRVWNFINRDIPPQIELEALLDAMERTDKLSEGLTRNQVCEALGFAYSRRVLVVRNTWEDLRKTTFQTFLSWFDANGSWQAQDKVFKWASSPLEFWWAGLDRPKDVAKVKSLEITDYMLDEASEIEQDIFLALQGRKGRHPKMDDALRSFLDVDPMAVIVSNPPDDEHWLVEEFETKPKAKYFAYYQPGGLDGLAENLRNLPGGRAYYEDLLEQYDSRPDLVQRYVNGKRAVIVRGKAVYGAEFSRDEHVTTKKLEWPGPTVKILRGWDASGNVPAAIVSWITPSGCWQIVKEFVTDIAGIEDFGSELVEWCAVEFPGAEYVDVADPATFARFSAPSGGLTSNAKILEQAFGLKLLPGIQQFQVRRDALAHKMTRRNMFMVYGPGAPRFVAGLEGGYAYPQLPEGRGFGDQIVKNKYSHVVEAAQYAATYFRSGHGNRQDLSKFRSHTASVQISA